MNTKLKEVIKLEKERNIRNMSFKHIFKLAVTREFDWLRYKYLKYMRCSVYYKKSILGIYYLYKKNRLAGILNYEINGENIGKGLTLYHNGPIVIHNKSKIGENLVLHGDNCIGNDGLSDLCPVIGNNVDVGVGAKILGNITIADNVTIGAGSVVVNSIDVPGAVVVGVPGKIIKVK